MVAKKSVTDSFHIEEIEAKSILRTHTDVVAHGEVFHRFTIYSPYYNPNKGAQSWPQHIVSLLLRNLRPVGFLESLIRRTCDDNPNAHYILFKLFWYHNRRILRHVIEDHRYRVIVLQRKNKLEQYSSRKIAMKTRQWVFRGDNVEKSLIHFDLTDFQRYVQRMEKGEANLKAALRGRDHFFLYYDEIGERIGELADWLGLSVADLPLAGPGVRKKQNSSSVLERFADPEDVRRQLADTKWGKFLD